MSGSLRQRSVRSLPSTASAATARTSRSRTCGSTPPDAVRKGGASGEPAVVPGEPAKSRLIQAVRHADGVEAMPPEKKLTDREIADLAKWVADGAVYPTPRARRRPTATHWAFLPAGGSAAARRQGRGVGPVAHRPLHPGRSSRRRGCGPPPPADKRTLIRRVTFDLTGLPPTPEEVDAFLADDVARRVREGGRPAARVAGLRRALGPALARRRPLRRLQRPRRERRPRQRLAVPRLRRRARSTPTSRTTGSSREQIAGDLLPAADAADPARAARSPPGSSRSGRRCWPRSDEEKMEMDIVDEQVDTVGRAVMGLTLGCARCHDHKFDPIPHGGLLRPGRHLREHEDDGARSRRSPGGTRTRSRTAGGAASTQGATHDDQRSPRLEGGELKAADCRRRTDDAEATGRAEEAARRAGRAARRPPRSCRRRWA